MPSKTARDVRGRAVEEVGAANSPGTRPHGNQTAVHFAARRRSFFWLRTESHFRASGNRTAAEPSGAGLLSFAELRAVPMDSCGRNRKTSARSLDGMDRR